MKSHFYIHENQKKSVLSVVKTMAYTLRAFLTTETTDYTDCTDFFRNAFC